MAMGSVLSIWHTYREEALQTRPRQKIPDMQELKQAAEHVDFEQVQIDPQASTVYLPDGEMSLDVGAIAKGYATKRLAETLKEDRRDLCCLKPWRQCRNDWNESRWNSMARGVQNPDPDAAQSYLHVVNLNDSCLGDQRNIPEIL